MTSVSLLAPAGRWPATAGGPTAGRVWLGKLAGEGDAAPDDPQEASPGRAASEESLQGPRRAGSWARRDCEKHAAGA